MGILINYLYSFIYLVKDRNRKLLIFILLSLLHFHSHLPSCLTPPHHLSITTTTHSTDRRALQEVSHRVKEANSKLSALHHELQELDSQILLTQGQAGAPLDHHAFTTNILGEYATSECM